MLDQTLTDALIYHHSMLQDEVRTSRFLQAILRAVEPDDVVLDIGSGTGILALFACLAGARHVYAVEQGPVIEMARQVCHDNGFTGRITFFNDWSTNIELPEPADVLVTETIGNAAFDEGILGWVRDAKERLLKPKARIIPQSVELIVAPVKSPTDYDLVREWRKDLYGFDFSAVRDAMAKELIWTQLSEKALLGTPATVAKIYMDQVINTDVGGEENLDITKNGWMHGLCVWFKATLIPGLCLSNEPPNQVMSWSQGFLPLAQPKVVNPGDHIQAMLRVISNGVSWWWQVGIERQSQPTARSTLAQNEKLVVNP